MSSPVPPPDSHTSTEEEGQPRWLTSLTRIIIKIFTPPSNSPPQSISAIQKSIGKLTFPQSESIVKSLHTSEIPFKQPTMIQVSVLQDLLQKFVNSTPDIQGAALVSPDGLPLSSVLATSMDEERTAAMSAAMLSLGERIGQELLTGMVERIFVEGEKGYSILSNCGEDAVLLVLANKATKKGLVFLEIKRLVAEIKPLLA
jgi:uncharacterized protein